MSYGAKWKASEKGAAAEVRARMWRTWKRPLCVFHRYSVWSFALKVPPLLRALAR